MYRQTLARTRQTTARPTDSNAIGPRGRRSARAVDRKRAEAVVMAVVTRLVIFQSLQYIYTRKLSQSIDDDEQFFRNF
jgi:hypothetical protein